MAKALRISFLASVLLVSASFHSAWAADEFGARFTNQAPAALGVSQSDALLATQDVEDTISAEDLNAIAPAAGDVSVPVASTPDVSGKAVDAPANKVGSGPFSADQGETDVPTETPAE